MNGAESNLTRVDDVLEQLQSQLTTLARQAKQAARYREIGEELRRSEGLLLYRRWREADLALQKAIADLIAMTTDLAKAQGAAVSAARLRAENEGKVPPLREEEAIAGAVLQRLLVERDSLNDQEKRARDTIENLGARIEQLANDINREAGLNRDAVETIERLEWEKAALAKAGIGHDDRKDAASVAAREAGSHLQDEESRLGKLTEDVARLSARHQSAHRLQADSKATLVRNDQEAQKAAAAVTGAEAAVVEAQSRHDTAEAAQIAAEKRARLAEAALLQAETARGEKQGAEADARAERSEAEGEANAIRAEVNALTRMVDRERAQTVQLLDQVKAAKRVRGSAWRSFGRRFARSGNHR